MDRLAGEYRTGRGDDLKCELTVNGKTQKTTYKKRDQFGPEFSYFSACILNDTEPEPNGLEGLADIRIINALRESEEKDRPVKLPPPDRREPPSSDQEIHKPAISKPGMVRAAAPSK
jgi:predicted dehydrogenase